jgi:DNA-binding response OmpR family regulator
VIVGVHPPVCSEGLHDGLALAATTVSPVEELAAESRAINDADILVVELADQPMRRLRELGRVSETIGLPTLAVLEPDQLALIESAAGVTDFIITPVDPVELRLRLRRLITHGEAEEVVTFKDLELNLLTYQATLGERPLDLTFMEYELLRYLVQNPVRVWSREQLLSKVWGYDYYGGARTVDVHVRRLRSKLGEERSSWITTVRSVGYRFG